MGGEASSPDQPGEEERHGEEEESGSWEDCQPPRTELALNSTLLSRVPPGSGPQGNGAPGHSN